MLSAGGIIMTRTVPGPLSGLSVLIVEDEFLIAIEAQQIVEDAGAAVAHPVNSVDAARAFLATGSCVDVAILDMRLGNEDGRALMNDLTDKAIPFVIASGLVLEYSGPAKVLMKPYRDIDLIEALRLTAAGR
jgi:CheY-like chemotaxis protein